MKNTLRTTYVLSEGPGVPSYKVRILYESQTKCECCKNEPKLVWLAQVNPGRSDSQGHRLVDPMTKITWLYPAQKGNVLA